MKNEYENWSKEDLVTEINKLRTRKKYGLVWEDTKEDVVEECKNHLPILNEVKSKFIETNENGRVNIFINGDNFHALSTLLYTHKESIDVIYIDPPYNTGAKDWKYNNDYVDVNDQWRHSKWISMMYRRLVMARKLLTKKGFLICAIDENEIHNIRHILDEIFGENNKVGTVTVLHNPKGRNLAKFFSENSEFMLVYAKDFNSAEFNSVAIDEVVKESFNESDEQGNYRFEPFMRVRTTWSRKNKPNNYYPIYVSKDFSKITLSKEKGYLEIYPITPDGREWAWKNIPESFKKLNKGNYFVAKEDENGRIQIFHKYREQQVFRNVWTDKKYFSEFNGTNLLKKIFGDTVFNYPKSLYLVEDILRMTTKNNSTVLDFFAGSGTTGHAILELNKEDGGNRRFILCTNNEGGIADEVCFPRLEKVIKGYGNGEDSVHGLEGNLKYFKTSFVSSSKTDANKLTLTKKAVDMLCIKEETYREYLITEEIKIFVQGKKHLAILLDIEKLSELKKHFQLIEGKIKLYIFSLGSDLYEEEFEEFGDKVTVSPIPEAIYKVYKRIFQ